MQFDDDCYNVDMSVNPGVQASESQHYFQTRLTCEISGSHGGEYEVQSSGMKRHVVTKLQDRPDSNPENRITYALQDFPHFCMRMSQ
jgi:ribosomal protein L21E